MAEPAALDRIVHKVRVDGPFERDLHYSFQLPPVWREATSSAREVSLSALDGRGALISVRAWSAQDLPPKHAERDVVSRMAFALQAEHEEALGRPAHSVSLEPVPPSGAVRWTATWVDGNLDNASRSFTTEAFFVELSTRWMLSMMFINVGGRPVRDALAESILSTIEVRRDRFCD